jgi:hypothetical protein
MHAKACKMFTVLTACIATYCTGHIVIRMLYLYVDSLQCVHTNIKQHI